MTTTMFRHPGQNVRIAAGIERGQKTLARSFDIGGLRLTRSAGTLVMEGYVPSYRMKKLAAATAARLPGTGQVVNRLRVVPQTHRRDAELVDAMRAALAACLQAAGPAIAISVQHGVVVLQGSVCCFACRCAVEAVAWAMGGVVDVRNGLRVGQGPTSHHRTGIPSYLQAGHR